MRVNVPPGDNASSRCSNNLAVFSDRLRCGNVPECNLVARSDIFHDAQRVRPVHQFIACFNGRLENPDIVLLMQQNDGVCEVFPGHC